LAWLSEAFMSGIGRNKPKRICNKLPDNELANQNCKALKKIHLFKKQPRNLINRTIFPEERVIII
jgi:hypothetical protein